MTAPGTSFLDFFVLEAGEYVEQLDGLVLRASAAGPDPDQLQKVARALRGSATMAKLSSFADLASGLEAIGRALRAGSLKWDERLKAVLTSTIDDFKILVRAVRAWSPSEDQLAMRRLGELGQYAQLPVGASTPAGGIGGGATFFASETNNIAAGLELLATRPDDRVGGANVLARVRALRGVAGVKEIPALSEVTEAAESAVKPLETGTPRLSPEHVNLLRASADLLRAISAALAGGPPVTTSTPQYRAFLAALDAVVAQSGGDRVIPIDQLYYDDAGPHILSVASNPPTTPAQRFRMEVVSLGEHLHRVIDEARRATDAIQQEHARGELGKALRAIRATASSFGQMAVAQTVDAHLESAGDLSPAAIDAISAFAASISPAVAGPPSAAPASVPIRPTHIHQVAEALGSAGPLPRTPAMTPKPAPAPTAPPAPTRTPMPAPPPAPARPPVAAAPPRPPMPPSALDAHIAAFDALSNERFAEPARLDDDVIPVDALLYRGRAALDRAVELRDAIRRAGGTPAPEVLEELYDLVELARVD